MPTGVMQWLNPDTGDGRVVRGGRRYAVRIDSVDSKARYPGARVHFDVDHDSEGDVAVNVVLREGQRSSPRQRRFGDMVGARARETKIETTGPEVESVRGAVMHPMAVAEHWAGYMAAGRLDDAVRLYSPTAAYHSAGGVAVGPRGIRNELAVSPIFSLGIDPDSVEGDGDSIRVSWSPVTVVAGALETHLVVRRGEIVEQWTGEVRSVAETRTEAAVQLSVEGAVSLHEREYALDKVGRAAASVAEPVRETTIRLEWLADPGRELRARARATVDIDGDPVRAQVSARTMNEAVDLLVGRLEQRMGHRSSHRTALRHRGPSSGPGEWRHGDEPGQRLSAPRRSAQTRAVVRRLTWSAAPSTIDEAVFDLEVLDLEFLLFNDLASGHDAVVSRRSGGTYAVAYTDAEGTADVPATTIAAVEVSSSPAPRLSLDEARQHLDEAGRAWVFFVDRISGRGQVLYQRDDGHDGLVTLPTTDIGSSTVDGWGTSCT